MDTGKPVGASSMTASLHCVSGPFKRQSFALDQELSLGRDISNTIRLQDSCVSQRHCVVTNDSGGYLIRDLDSQNGTLVNGIRVKQQPLENGDTIKVGTSVFQFNVDGAEVPRAAGVCFEDPPLAIATGSTFAAEAEVATHLSKERLVHDFGALLTIATRLRGTRDSESLLWQLAGVLLELMPAERIAILLGDDLALQPAFAWDRESGPGVPVGVSRTVVNQVASTQMPLLVNDVPESMPVSSMRDLEVFSVLCVPVSTPEKKLGVIYLDTRKIGCRFDTGHLHLMSAIATIAALALENTRSLESLEQENQRFKAETLSRYNMIGSSAAMQDIYRFIAKVAPSGANVIIYGESGSGKELVARAIHQNSPRAEKPFVAINCAAITESLLESELFGYEKGAFTGAQTQKHGYLEAAHEGTIFLDEISELALPLQAKLLRALQEREVVRVGGTRPIKVDLQVLASTNQPLAQHVKDGRFREDLFYRLDVVSCHVPALRDRREDIPILADHFARKYATKCHRKLTGISATAMACLTQYDWPGNVRELENAIERAVVLGCTPQIVRDDLPESLSDIAAFSADAPTGYHAEVARRKRELILSALKQSNHSFTRAAQLLGIHPNYLHRLIRILNLRPEVERLVVGGR